MSEAIFPEFEAPDRSNPKKEDEDKPWSTATSAPIARDSRTMGRLRMLRLKKVSLRLPSRAKTRRDSDHRRVTTRNPRAKFR